MTSNLTWSKNDLSIFCRTCHGLSNAVYRLSLSFLVFAFSGGRSSAPPPGRAKVAQTPGRAQVNKFVMQPNADSDFSAFIFQSAFTFYLFSRGERAKVIALHSFFSAKHGGHCTDHYDWRDHDELWTRSFPDERVPLWNMAFRLHGNIHSWASPMIKVRHRPDEKRRVYGELSSLEEPMNILIIQSNPDCDFSAFIFLSAFNFHSFSQRKRDKVIALNSFNVGKIISFKL